jgi:hemolysin III
MTSIDEKPKLRGWIHAVMTPVVVVAAIVLFGMADTAAARVSVVIFSASAIMLFGTSAVYHRGTWGETAVAILRRMDHSNIFLIIAGTYTPLAVLLLSSSQAKVLLVIVWTGALVGLLARVFWLSAPRWLYVPIYVGLGWVAVGYLQQFWNQGSPTIVWLVLGGGVAYSVGAVVYGMKRPNPVPGVFGFHEIFHSLTVVGFVCHYIAVRLALQV